MKDDSKNGLHAAEELTTNFVKLDDAKDTLGNATSKGHERLEAIDLFRGLIMVIMAWDHSKDFLANKKVPKDQGGSAWSGQLGDFDHNFLLFFARFISHFCAPGFFYTMGISMFLFTKSRLFGKRWTKLRIIKHFMIRAFVLLVVGRLVDLAIIFQVIPVVLERKSFPILKIFGGSIWTISFIGIWEVMTGLSYVMGITGFFIPYFVSYMHRKREKNKTNVGLKLLPLSIFIVGVLLFCFSNYTIVQAQNGDPCGPFCKDIANNETVAVKWPRESSVAVGFWQIFLRYTLIPGRFSSGIIIYPLIPWISITLFGMVHGYGFSYNPEQAYAAARYIGILCLGMFVLVRLYGKDGYLGNLRGLPRDGVQGDWLIAFLNVCKYPPSVAYALITLGVDLICLGAIQKLGNTCRCCTAPHRGKPTMPLVKRILFAYGKAPLFFYLIHFQVLGILSMVFHFFGNGFDLDLVPIPYFFVMVLMYFICKKYSKYKRSLGSESWVRNYL